MDYIGEPVSVIAHSLQAAHFAKPLGDDEVMVAALLHDIGHAIGMEAGYEMGMSGCGFEDHEGVAAVFLADLGFTIRIQQLVRNHVSAKRYLCYKYPDYFSRLTDASKTTLSFQGGVMSAAEAQLFESHPDFLHFLNMRTVDEAAKVPGLCVSSLQEYDATVRRFTAGAPSLDYVLSAQQRNFFQEHGFLKIPNLISFYDAGNELFLAFDGSISENRSPSDDRSGSAKVASNISKLIRTFAVSILNSEDVRIASELTTRTQAVAELFIESPVDSVAVLVATKLQVLIKVESKIGSSLAKHITLMPGEILIVASRCNFHYDNKSSDDVGEHEK
jgi:predicted HD phosphohydrolase